MQFASNLFLMTGAAIFILTLNVRLGLAALAPALGVLVVTRLLSAWVKRKNLKSLQSLGGMSAEIQESLSNFKVIVAFNRLDYFRQKFNDANEQNFAASVGAGLANNVFMPIYGLAFNLAQLIVLSYGMYLIAAGQLTVGVLIGFLLYVNSFYIPAPPARRGVGVVPAGAGGARSHFGGARARVEHAGGGVCGARPAGPAPSWNSSTSPSAIRADRKC